MTYNVFSGTLNPYSINQSTWHPHPSPTNFTADYGLSDCLESLGEAEAVHVHNRTEAIISRSRPPRRYILSHDYLPHAAVIINPAGARSWRRWPFSLRMRGTRLAPRVGRNLMTASRTAAAGGLTCSKKCGRPMFTFRVRRSRGEMCIGHARLCVSVCLSLAAFPLLH